MVMQIRRTPTANNPPTALAEGQLAVEMASDPPRLWCGVPVALDASGRVLISPQIPQLKISTQLFTSSGTYTPPPGLQWAIVECRGGGGGGGGVGNNGVQAYTGASGGGGQGSYASSTLSAVQIGASQTVTIGAGGAGGAQDLATALAGGATSFGALVAASGGSPGTGSFAGGGAGGGGSSGTGTLVMQGMGGRYGTIGLAAAITVSISAVLPIGGGGGGASHPGPAVTTPPGVQPGVNGAMGCGGGGAAIYAAGTNAAGGNGGSGWCLITEYSF